MWRSPSPGAGATTVTTLAYDGDGVLRVETAGDGTVTHHVDRDYRVDAATGAATVYYRFGGRAVAWRDGAGTRDVLADHLGSSQGEVQGQAELSQRRSLPFGGDRPVPGAADLTKPERFTGQWRLDAGGGNPTRELYRFGDQPDPRGPVGGRGRPYLPVVGIFIQPDARVPTLLDPRGLNRYAYALDNPIKYTDPTGDIVWIAVGVGAVVGAVAGGVGYVAGSWFSEHPMTLSEGLVAAGVGAGAGAMAPIVATTTVGAMALGAGANVVQYGLTQATNGDPWDTRTAGMSAGLGAVGGRFGGSVSRDALEGMAGSAARRSVAPATDQMGRAVATNEFVRQQAVTGVGRSSVGSSVSNLDADRLQDRIRPSSGRAPEEDDGAPAMPTAVGLQATPTPPGAPPEGGGTAAALGSWQAPSDLSPITNRIMGVE